MKYTDELDKVSYSLGLSIASNLISSGVTTINAEAFIDGLNVVFSGKMPEIMPDEANNILQDYFDKLQQAKGKEAKAEGEKFLAENKAKKDVITTESGLQYQVVTEGTGAKPTAEDVVKVHYTGTLLDGTKFDSSLDHGGEPAQFPVGGVIKGWTEVLQLMPVGSKYIVWIPSELAYGTQGAGRDIKPNSTLKFEIELLDIVKDSTAEKK